MSEHALVVIGAGAGGLVIAVGAAKAGKKVLIIEKGKYGGDCTNFGCIPSKSLIASAHLAHSLKTARTLGIELSSSTFGASEALSRVREIVAGIRSHHEPKELSELGIETLDGEASFQGPRTLKVGGREINAKQIVIATGTSPRIPPIPGLSNTPYLTNETIFNLKEIPKTLAVLGGGPIGCELAQAFQRLGSQVFLIHSHDQLLNKEEPLAQETIAKQLTSEGMELFLGTHAKEVKYNNSFQISLENGKNVQADALLVAIGRKVNVKNLNLEAAGVTYSENGIPTDRYGRTNQRHIWAIGDVTGPPFFTHLAENRARSVLTSLLLPFRKKLDDQAVPRVTFTDPEVASVGLLETEAAQKHTIATYIVPMSAIDRAITASKTEGFIKVVTKKWSSQILGCTIVAPRAGEMLSEITLAMRAKISLHKLSSLIHPYPTYSGAIRKAADLYLTQTLLSILGRKKS